MQRREFIRLLGGWAAAWPLAAHAQGERMRRVAILMPYPAGDILYQKYIQLFRQELRKLGWIENKNVQFDERWTTDNMALVRAGAANLLELKPDAVIAVGGRVIPILKQMTQSVPIIMPGSADPVGTGLVASLARPGGNVTGYSAFELSVIGKQLETLKQSRPRSPALSLFIILIIRALLSLSVRLWLPPRQLRLSRSWHPFTILQTLMSPWKTRRNSKIPAFISHRT
jgi:putative tryptophan/tyrosine transport system substrate-binding protein